MNKFQTELYNNLMVLVSTNEAFYMKDQELDGITYRVFSYRLASYTDFLLPGALECRGIMYEIDGSGQPIRLVVMPFSKFFNVGENPMVMGLDFEDPQQIMLKMDGSLIGSFIHNGELLLKSKTSLFSEHVVRATKFLNKHIQFKEELKSLTEKGWTVNMEFISPDYEMRIVIGYPVDWLTVLSIRDIEDGRIITKDEIDKDLYPEIHNHWVERFTYEDYGCVTGQEFIDLVPTLVDIEGFVIILKSGQFVKIKTDWYKALHHTKDSVNNPRRLFEAVLEEATDDLKSMFVDDINALKLIEEMEIKVSKIYNHLSSVVETFYVANRMLDRPSYAIKGQKELTKHEFGLAMNRYLGKEVDVKGLMLKRFKDFGIKDEKVDIE